jgi:PAS domain S-box-containing protein
MRDEDKTKEQVINELAELRRRVAELEAAQTEHKRTEEALRESELRHRTLFESVPLGVGLATLDGRVLTYNDAMLEMTGYSGAELGQINLRDTYRNPEERVLLLKRLQADGFVRDFEVELKRKDDTPYYASLTLTSFTLGGEDVILTISKDITERVQAEKVVRRRNRELALLNRVSQELTVTLDLQQVAEQLLQATTEIIGAEGASVWLRDEEQEDRLVCWAASYQSQELRLVNIRLAPGQGIASTVMQSRESVIVPHAPDDPRFFSGVDEQTGLRTLSLLAVPLWFRGKVIGVLEAVNKLKGHFDRDDLILVETLAASAAIAIENARLYQQTDEKLQTRARELSALYALTEVMNHSLDLDSILRLALDSAVELMGMDAGGILLLDLSTNEIILRAHRGLLPGFSQLINRAKTNKFLMSRMLESVLAMDDLSKLTKDHREVIEREGIQSAVSVPLKTKERILGVMVVVSYSPRTFTSEELELLAAIGNQVGVAVDRANLQTQELRAAILEERQAMAWQMHDDIAQTLGYLGLQVDSVMGSSSLAQKVGVQAELEGIRRSIENAYERVRSSIMRLRGDIPDYFDLGTALQKSVSEFEAQTGYKVETKIDEGQLRRLSPSVVFQATYIVHEALTNVRKHSGADSVHFTLEGTEDGVIVITIQDNGEGFDLDDDRWSSRGGFGLRFMRERAERAGGSLRVESQPGQGVQVVISLPSS